MSSTTYSTNRRNTKAAILLATTMLATAGAAYAQQAAPATVKPASETGGLQEIIVTAQKRSENLQKVPVSIQAFSTKQLDQLKVTNFSDYAKYLPSLSYQSLAPGMTNVYIRGVATGGDGNHSASLPSVGIYLDEQPVTTIQGALDVHIYDIARVEALSGPQGTLYGASSQSGTIRIITNKPDKSKFSAGYNAEINSVAHGGEGFIGEGYVNEPLSDKMAIRLVGFYQHDAGYIDNKPGTLTYPNSGAVLNNSSIAKNGYNDVSTYGGRAALKVDLNESWTATPSVIFQDQKQHGIFAYDATAATELSVSHFYPEFSHDRWWQAAFTVEGKLQNLNVVYAGSYLNRKIDNASDYTDYSLYYDQPQYYNHFVTDITGTPFNPSQHINGKDRFTKQSHEIRISSPSENRLRFVAGAFYQRQSHYIFQQYVIDSLPAALSIPNSPNTWWQTAQQRIDRDYALFGEVSYSITDKLKATAGIRGFKSRNSLEGFFGFSAAVDTLLAAQLGSSTLSTPGAINCFGPSNIAAAPCENLNKSVSETGETHKVNLTYQIDPAYMVYATYSTGFRPGGINRRGSLPPYKSDKLVNYELGWKTKWFDNNVRFNGAVYWEDWKNVQYAFLGANSLTQIENAGSARIKGIEADVIWKLDDHLTLSSSGAYNDAKLQKNLCKIFNVQFDCTLPGADGSANALKAPAGTRLPITPRFKINGTARYTFKIDDIDAHLQGSVVHQSSSSSDLRVSTASALGTQRQYTLADFTAGIERDSWSFELSMKNAFDARPDYYRYQECGSCSSVRTYVGTSVPRTFGAKFSQKF